MKDLFLELDHRILHLIHLIGHEAKVMDTKAYLVGGIVRDLFLKKENFDIDIVVEGDGIALAEAVVQKRNAKITSYPKFKTASVFFQNGIVIDFATTRRETYERSGALPQVFDGSIHDDLFRRDFTINAMAITLNNDSLGALVDDFAGFKDLIDRKIRILHPQSFYDDPTRILRAVRFQTRFGFQIESDTLRLMKKAVKEGVINNVKSQRWFEEFRKNLNEVNAPQSIRQLASIGAMKFLSKKFSCDFGLLNRIQKNLNSKKMTEDRVIDGSVVYLMALLFPFGESKSKKIMQNWQLTRGEVSKILSIFHKKDLQKALSSKKLRHSDIYRRLEGLSLEALAFFYATSQNREYQRNILLFQEKLMDVHLEITGDDLKNLGVAEGKKIKLILDEVLNNRIDGVVFGRLNEIQFAQKLISKS